MLVLLDTNIFLSALLTFDGPPGRIYREWRSKRFDLVTSTEQLDDPADSYLLDLIEAAQPDYAVTGDKRSGLLQLGKMGRKKILSATAFSSKVLHL
jgi:hypothetical protein